MSHSVQGQVLIASPMLTDPNFFRTVVYMARHSSEGALGMIVNRPSELRFEELIEQQRGQRPRRCDWIYHGGPCEGPLLALHAMTNVGDDCDDRVWMTSDDDHLMLLAERAEVSARFFTGYAGWGPGQLEAEMAAGGWLASPCQDDWLWGDPDDVWELAIKHCGHSILRSVLPSAGCVDPQLN